MRFVLYLSVTAVSILWGAAALFFVVGFLLFAAGANGIAARDFLLVVSAYTAGTALTIVAFLWCIVSKRTMSAVSVVIISLMVYIWLSLLVITGRLGS